MPSILCVPLDIPVKFQLPDLEDPAFDLSLRWNWTQLGGLHLRLHLLTQKIIDDMYSRKVMWPIISIIQVLALKSPDRFPGLREFENSLLLD